MQNLSNITEVSSSINPPVDVLEVAFSLGVTLFLAVIMFFTFKYSRSGMVYDPKFNSTLVLIALVVTIIMHLIQTNLALSVGMMGSLSIVRFRTNTKDPRDLGFVFWAMAIGLASATQNFVIGLIGSVVIAVFLFITGDRRTSSRSMLVVIRGSRSNVPLIADTVLRNVSNARLKAQNLLPESFELVYEIKTRSEVEQRLLDELMTIDGIDSVNMLAPSAEVA